ncbi:divergent polysaccharide deacetylase family protein [Falsiroseomonas sp.]|uniref:divergent polysaccharide deacetylase family protein n=1 Tax=Falsiroseomonas sp. TaxID=2870721 RepID=UPI0035661051
MGRFGLRALLLFWAALLAAVAGGGAMLAWLGPPPPPLVAEAPAPEAPAQPVLEAFAAPVAEPPPAAVAPSAPVAAAPPATPPSAPEPPPLVAAAAGTQAIAAPVIAPPDPALLEVSRHGQVPRLGPDNRSSIRAYARPFDREDRRPRIGIIISNMGAHGPYSEDAIRRLPSGVTFAFSPYALRTEPLVERARARGMELLTALPLEPAGFGQRADPGDRALLTSLPINENMDRLNWALSRMQGQVGAIGGLGGMRGERFATNGELLGTLQAALTRRGLLYVDPRPGAPQPARAFGRSVDLLLDEPSEVRVEVERRLAELEALARRQNSALGLASNPMPSVVAAIAGWSAGLEERGVVIAPISVLIRRPAEQAGR